MQNITNRLTLHFKCIFRSDDAGNLTGIMSSIPLSFTDFLHSIILCAQEINQRLNVDIPSVCLHGGQIKSWDEGRRQSGEDEERAVLSVKLEK